MGMSKWRLEYYSLSFGYARICNVPPQRIGVSACMRTVAATQILLATTQKGLAINLLYLIDIH